MIKFILPFNDSSLSILPNSQLHRTFAISLTSWHVLTVYYTFNILLGLLGNCLVLHAFQFPDVLDYKKVSLVILTNLAVTDILVLLVQGIPTIGVFAADSWQFGSVACHFQALLKYVLFFMEISLVTMLIVHRAYILIYPFKGRLITKRGTVKAVIVFWVVSVLLNVVGLMGSDTTLFDPRFLSCNAGIYLQANAGWEGYVLSFYLLGATLTLIVSLILVGWKARQARLRSQCREAATAHFNLHQFSRTRRFWNFVKRNKSTVTVVAIAVIFLLCMVPVFLVHLLKYVGVPFSAKLTLAQEIVVMYTAVVNPCIYSITNPTFIQFYRERWTS